ncbi:hypothetical protein LXL04_038860 [Taraxacum kok-saghyz]
MVARSNPINHQYSNHNEQEQDQDDNRSRNNSYGFLHDNPISLNVRGHVQTSSKTGGVVLAESCNDHQLVSNGANHNQVQQKAVVLGLKLRTRKIEKNNHQQVLSQSQRPLKLPASNFPAVSLRVGSWTWESKNPRDLTVKIYFGKKKLVWEFLRGSMKKKMEIEWAHVSAIKDYVDEDENGRLEIELENPPTYYEEHNFQRLKHTQWKITEDFTGGQAPNCRRHTIRFSPGVLDDHLKKLLKCDNGLYNLYRQPFPSHKSPFFNGSFHFSHNINVVGSSLVPPSNPFQPTTMQGLTLQNSNERSLGVWEQSGNNQFVDTPLPPIREPDDNELFQGMSDEQIELLLHVAMQNLPEVTTEQTCFKVDSSCQTFEQNHENISDHFVARTDASSGQQYQGLLQPINSDDQLELLDLDIQKLPDVTNEQNGFMVDSTCKALEQNHQSIFDPFGGITDGSCSNGGVISHDMAFMDEVEDDVSRYAQLLFHDEPAIDPGTLDLVIFSI